MVAVQKDDLTPDNSRAHTQNPLKAGVSLERDNKTAVDKKAASTSANKNAGKQKKPTSIRTAAHQGSLKELEQMLKDGVGGCLLVCLSVFVSLTLTLTLLPQNVVYVFISYPHPLTRTLTRTPTPNPNPKLPSFIFRFERSVHAVSLLC